MELTPRHAPGGTMGAAAGARSWVSSASHQDAADAGDYRRKNERHGVDYLDERVDGRTGRVLVRVTDRVTDDRGLVRFAALPAVVAILDVLLRVAPGATAVGHGERQHQAAGDDADEQPAEGDGTPQETDRQRRGNGNEARQGHLPERGFRDDVHRGAVIRFLRAVHYAGQLPELTPDFFDDAARGLADRLHQERTEQERQHRPDEQAEEDYRVVQAEFEVRYAFREVSEQDECRQGGGTDGVPLGDGLGRVAHRVKRVGVAAHLGRQVRHFGNAAGIVRDRPVRVHGHYHSGYRQHRHRRYGDAVQAGQHERPEDGERQDDGRHECRVHADRQAADDVRGAARFTRPGDAPDRPVLRARVVLGDGPKQDGD